MLALQLKRTEKIVFRLDGNTIEIKSNPDQTCGGCGAPNRVNLLITAPVKVKITREPLGPVDDNGDVDGNK